MKYLILVLSLVLAGCAGQTPYALVGAGYKISETPMTWHDGNGNKLRNGNDEYSARFELGLDADSFRYGLSHDSNWLNGAPFNGEGEYQKTEVFIDYVYRFKPIKE